MNCCKIRRHIIFLLTLELTVVFPAITSAGNYLSDGFVQLRWEREPLMPDDVNRVTITLTGNKPETRFPDHAGISIQMLDSRGQCRYEIKNILSIPQTSAVSTRYRTTLPFWLPVDTADMRLAVTVGLFHEHSGTPLRFQIPGGVTDRIQIGTVRIAPAMPLSGTHAQVGRTVSGCYALEEDETGTSFRWLSGDAVIAFDNPFCAADIYIEISGPFSPQIIPYLDISIHETLIDKIRLSSVPIRNIYHLPLAFIGNKDTIEIRFHSAKTVVPSDIRPTTDNRRLSVRLYRCRLIPEN